MCMCMYRGQHVCIGDSQYRGVCMYAGMYGDMYACMHVMEYLSWKQGGKSLLGW